jgi:hypothetical protein
MDELAGQPFGNECLVQRSIERDRQRPLVHHEQPLLLAAGEEDVLGRELQDEIPDLDGEDLPVPERAGLPGIQSGMSPRPVSSPCRVFFRVSCNCLDGELDHASSFS